MDFQEPEYFSKQIREAKRFYRPPAPEGRSGVIAGGREICAPGYRIERKDFPYIAMEFVSAGKGRLLLSDKNYPLDPGTLFLYGPGQSHTIEIDEGERLEKYFVNLLPADSLLDSPLYGKVIHTSRPQSILLSFEELLEYGRDPSPLSEKICSCLFELIMEKAEATALRHGEFGSPAYRSFRRCKTVLGTNFLEWQSMEEAAEACGVSEAYLCRLFSRFDNQTPYRYISGLKMNYAADLILTEGLSVKEAADRLGYPDQGHFSRTFKRVLGTNPSSLGHNL